MSFIGLNEAGIVVPGGPGAPVRIGAVTSPAVLLAIFCFLFMAMLMVRHIPGAILGGILVTTFLSYALGLHQPPQSWISTPPSLGPTFLKLDIAGALHWGYFPVILTIFVMAFVDTMGTLIGVSARAGFLDAEGNLPQIERPMLADALSTTFASLVGTTTSGLLLNPQPVWRRVGAPDLPPS